MQKDGISVDKMLRSCYSESKYMISIANHKSFTRLRRALVSAGRTEPSRALAKTRARLPRRADRPNPLLQLASKPTHFNAISFPLRSSGRQFPGYSGLFRAIPATAKLSCSDLANQPRCRPIQPFIHRVNPTKSDQIKPLTFFSGRNPHPANPHTNPSPPAQKIKLN
jgi:hypothetical protein